MNFDQGYILLIIVAVAIASGLDYVDTRKSGYPSWVLDGNRKVNARTIMIAPFLVIGMTRVLLMTVPSSIGFEDLAMSFLLSAVYVAALCSLGRAIGARQNKRFA